MEGRLASRPYEVEKLMGFERKNQLYRWKMASLMNRGKLG
jgi:hypothetical protein